MCQRAECCIIHAALSPELSAPGLCGHLCYCSSDAAAAATAAQGLLALGLGCLGAAPPGTNHLGGAGAAGIHTRGVLPLGACAPVGGHRVAAGRWGRAACYELGTPKELDMGGQMFWLMLGAKACGLCPR